jgi:hypothetical protein
VADKKLQNADTFRALLSQVECGDFEFVIRERNGDYSLQIQFNALDNESADKLPWMRKVERQFCRIWPLQDTMCDSEVVRTAWHAAKAATMHELEERFKFQGEMIFCPHMNVHKLVELRRQDDVDQIREPLPGSEPARFGTAMEEL